MTADRQRDLVAVAASAGRALVLDADALISFKGAVKDLAGHLADGAPGEAVQCRAERHRVDAARAGVVVVVCRHGATIPPGGIVIKDASGPKPSAATAR